MNHAQPTASVLIEDDRRRHRRIQVLLAVHIDAGDQPQVGRVVDLSRKGARVQVAGQVLQGQRVVIRRAGVAIGAQVAWRRGAVIGVEFDTPMEERSFLQLRRGG